MLCFRLRASILAGFRVGGLGVRFKYRLSTRYIVGCMACVGFCVRSRPSSTRTSTCSSHLACICIYAQAYAHVYIYIYTHTHIHTHISVCVCRNK